TAPVLCAIGAEVSLLSQEGERRIPVEELYHDDGIKFLNKRSNELITHIHLPPHDAHMRSTYRKLRRRGSFDFPVLGVAAVSRRGGVGAAWHGRRGRGGEGSLDRRGFAPARGAGRGGAAAWSLARRG